MVQAAAARRQGPGLEAGVLADQGVLHHRQVGEQAQVLEGAGDPLLEDLVRREAHHLLAVETDRTLFRLHERR